MTQIKGLIIFNEVLSAAMCYNFDDVPSLYPRYDSLAFHYTMKHFKSPECFPPARKVYEPFEKYMNRSNIIKLMIITGRNGRV